MTDHRRKQLDLATQAEHRAAVAIADALNLSWQAQVELERAMQFITKAVAARVIADLEDDG